ncbi:16423_t:CDS:10 [Dentiscutata erythropus]|uniref:16423_t:CDS:1 n=1 Tax=Dentiscutata erythropus TaxID=1348616 RepID=A0A9N8WK03_9GLOM|nr:16423_t:CDS:10 [Dentiscutata erythropus]
MNEHILLQSSKKRRGRPPTTVASKIRSTFSNCPIEQTYFRDFSDTFIPQINFPDLWASRGTNDENGVESTTIDQVNETTAPLRLKLVVRDGTDDKSNMASMKPPRKKKPIPMDHKEELNLLLKLENIERPLSPKTYRLKRKLHLRRIKRGLGLKIFDIDTVVSDQMRSNSSLELMAMTEENSHEPKKNEVKNFEIKTSDIEFMDQITKITHTPYKNSFASRLFGNPRLATTLTVEEAWTSPLRRKLKPYIRRDYETKPPKLCLLQEIVKYAYRNEPDWLPPPSSPIDFCYFQKEHLNQVNDLLQRCFWPSIDVSENLLFPDFSVVAMYRRLVIGCGFMTPEAYITYIAVAPGWEKSGIGQFMLYHLVQTNIGKDVTLHVSANNPAMILYQKFGFKPEEFIVNFYDKYLPDGSLGCKNAFFVRLRR